MSLDGGVAFWLVLRECLPRSNLQRDTAVLLKVYAKAEVSELVSAVISDAWGGVLLNKMPLVLRCIPTEAHM